MGENILIPLGIVVISVTSLFFWFLYENRKGDKTWD
jgi:hypothetical protein